MIKEKTYYVSSDGKHFDNRESAENYERQREIHDLADALEFYLPDTVDDPFGYNRTVRNLVFRYVNGDERIFERLRHLIEKGIEAHTMK